MKSFTFDANDERNYIFLVPIGQEKAFTEFANKNNIKILTSKKNGIFRFFFLYLPEDLKKMYNTLSELQGKYLKM